MAIINFLTSATLTNWVGKLLELLFNGIKNFGWTVVVFSIILKVVLSPLDIWQRVSMKNQQKKMEALKPKLEKLEKQYRNNPDLLKQKQYEVQREAKINVFATCLPLIVTMVIFFVVFSGFRALVTYENEVVVEELDKTYVEFVLEYNADKLTEAQKAEVDITNWDALKAYCEDSSHNVKDGFSEYEEIQTESKRDNTDAYSVMRTKLADEYQKHLKKYGWLWVKNVFKSDTGTDVIPSVKAYTSSGAGGISAKLEDTQTHTTYTNLTSPAAEIMNKQKTWDIAKWNGYFILPLLSLLTSFLSTFIMQKTGSQATSAVGTAEQQAQQQKQMKMMNYMMPVMLAVFAMLYSSAFAIYYFMSNVMATITTLVVNMVMKFIDKKKAAQEQQGIIIQ